MNAQHKEVLKRFKKDYPKDTGAHKKLGELMNYREGIIKYKKEVDQKHEDLMIDNEIKLMEILFGAKL